MIQETEGSIPGWVISKFLAPVNPSYCHDEQDMTQSQFFKKSLASLNSEFFLLFNQLPYQG